MVYQSAAVAVKDGSVGADASLLLTATERVYRLARYKKIPFDQQSMESSQTEHELLKNVFLV